jgi:hypothetical protein
MIEEAGNVKHEAAEHAGIHKWDENLYKHFRTPLWTMPLPTSGLKAVDQVEILGSGAVTVLALTCIVKKPVFEGSELPNNPKAEIRVHTETCRLAVV